MDLKHYKDFDRPARLIFTGGPRAERLNLILEHSYRGVMRKNFVSEGEHAGFLSSSVDGRPWTDTMWTRDAGTMLREIAACGEIGSACLLAERLMALCLPNEKGYYVFPEYFRLGEPNSGTETDGTASILIAFAKLYEILRSPLFCERDFADRLAEFSTGRHAPLTFFAEEIESRCFLLGSGEFGGGLNVEGDYFNIVQNMLAGYAMTCWAEALERTGERSQTGKKLRETAAALERNVRQYFVRDGKWIWCLDPSTLRPEERVARESANVGFAGINGVWCMASDAEGFDLSAWPWQEVCRNTFFDLLNFPLRREQLEKWGIYTQFNTFCHGLLSSAYGIGYALQCAVLMRDRGLLDSMLTFFVDQTISPHPRYQLTREDPYWTYERMLSPDYFELPPEQQDVGEGCGALNVVNVAEYLKLARLMTGVEPSGKDAPPFLPADFTGFSLENVILLSPDCGRYDVTFDGKNLKKQKKS